MSVQCQTDFSWESSAPLRLFLADLDRRRGSTQATSGSAVADAQVPRESARQADKSGSSGVGPSSLTKRYPSTQGAGSTTSPKSQASTVGARPGSPKRRNSQPSMKVMKVLVEGVWVDVKEILNPNRHPSAKATTSSLKKSVEERCREGQSQTLEKESKLSKPSA